MLPASARPIDRDTRPCALRSIRNRGVLPPGRSAAAFRAGRWLPFASPDESAARRRDPLRAHAGLRGYATGSAGDAARGSWLQTAATIRLMASDMRIQ